HRTRLSFSRFAALRGNAPASVSFERCRWRDLNSSATHNDFTPASVSCSYRRLLRLVGRGRHHYVPSSPSAEEPALDTNLFRYVWHHSRREQILILLLILMLLPLYFASLDIPRLIVNDALQGRAF